MAIQDAPDRVWMQGLIFLSFPGTIRDPHFDSFWLPVIQIFILSEGCIGLVKGNMTGNHRVYPDSIPVVPHKAVAEVSKIGNL